MSNEIQLLNNTDLTVIFDGSLKPLLDKIEKEVSDIVPDTSTKKGRDEIKALSFKVTKSKTAIDAQGEILVGKINDEMQEFTNKKKLINASRKESNLFLAELSKKIRLPLTEYEKEQSAQIERDLILKLMDEAISENKLFDKEIELSEKERIIEQKEVEQKAELDRIQRENEIREEEKAKVELARINAIESEKRAVQAEKDRIESERLAKIKADKLAKQREIERIEAEKQSIIDRENAVKAESARLEKVKADALKKALADKEHVRKINFDAMSCFVLSGFSEIDAKKIITLIVQKKIDNVEIKY